MGGLAGGLAGQGWGAAEGEVMRGERAELARFQPSAKGVLFWCRCAQYSAKS